MTLGPSVLPGATGTPRCAQRASALHRASSHCRDSGAQSHLVVYRIYPVLGSQDPKQAICHCIVGLRGRAKAKWEDLATACLAVSGHQGALGLSGRHRGHQTWLAWHPGTRPAPSCMPHQQTYSVGCTRPGRFRHSRSSLLGRRGPR